MILELAPSCVRLSWHSSNPVNPGPVRVVNTAAKSSYWKICDRRMGNMDHTCYPEVAISRKQLQGEILCPVGEK